VTVDGFLALHGLAPAPADGPAEDHGHPDTGVDGPGGAGRRPLALRPDISQPGTGRAA
jgi:hypothetical protein